VIAASAARSASPYAETAKFTRRSRAFRALSSDANIASTAREISHHRVAHDARREAAKLAGPRSTFEVNEAVRRLAADGTPASSDAAEAAVVDQPLARRVRGADRSTGRRIPPHRQLACLVYCMPNTREGPVRWLRLR
jgi:hypothetical protein